MTLACIDEGHGEPIVLVHGFPVDGRLWDGVRSKFAHTHRVIVPDLRGFGRSRGEPAVTTVDAHSDDLAALLDTLGIAKTTLVGLSLGGYVALAFARRHAARLARLGLVHTRAAPDSPDARAARDASIVRVRTEGPVAVVDPMLPRLFPHGAPPLLAAWFRDVVLSQSGEAIIAALMAMRDRPDATPVLATIDVPSVVVSGEHDVISPPAESLQMARAMPHGAYVEIPGVGHFSPLEQPAAFVTALGPLLSHAPG